MFGVLIATSHFEVFLKHVWDNAVRNAFTILVEVFAILRLTSLLIADRTVREQNREEEEVKVRQGIVKATRKTPCQSQR